MAYEWAISVTKRRVVTIFGRVSAGFYAAAIVSCITFSLAVMACSRTASPEEQVRIQLNRLVQAAADRDIAVLQDGLTMDFRGNQTLAKKQLVTLIATYLQQNRSVTVTTMNITIRLDNDRVISQFKLLLTGSDDVLPDRLRWLEVTLNWVNIENSWRIQSALWRDVGS